MNSVEALQDLQEQMHQDGFSTGWPELTERLFFNPRII